MLRPLPSFQTDSNAFVPLYTLVVPIRHVCPPLERQRLGETNFLDASLSGMTTTRDVMMAFDAFLISEGEIGAPGVGLLPPHVLLTHIGTHECVCIFGGGRSHVVYITAACMYGDYLTCAPLLRKEVLLEFRNF